MEKEIKLAAEEARKLYEISSDEFKIKLEDTFGKKLFLACVMDRVKTYEDACAELLEKPIVEDDILWARHSKDGIAYHKLKTIVRALNERWEVDGIEETRYFPRFYHNESPSGFAFGYSSFDHSDVDAGSGSRLCFKSSELSDYAGQQFIDLWEEFIV